jgi:Arc/MetJ-type ribon-helix-helix transcriptional regulator/RNA polymerase subunit RPABC4/transcription elongation factor Spt4
MSKLTFRADDDLVARVEELDASKSEVMREALREYLGETASSTEYREDSLDGFLARRVDELLEDRLGPRGAPARDVNVNVTVEGTPTSAEVSDGASAAASDPSPDASVASDGDADRSPGADGRTTCGQCGEPVDGDHVYCPNCGEKRSRRVFCECGDELRTDWSFCPGCGRRTPAADVLDGS